MTFRPHLVRLWNSSVAWSWLFNGLRLGSGVLLLPLLLQLPKPDFGFYWVLLSLASLVPLLDLGFLTSIDRAIGYAMAGATDLRSHGLAKPTGDHRTPNYPLLWKLLFTSRSLYRLFSLGVFVILGSWGTYVVHLRVLETSQPGITWLAWSLTLAGAVFEMYSGWWNVYLRGLNEVLLCSRILVAASLVKFSLSCALLLGGGGLLSVPLATFVSAFLQRGLSKRFCLRRLSAHPPVTPPRAEVWSLIRVLWPNSWRVGLYYLSGYLTVSANTFVCFKVLGLAANAEYNFSVQIILICQTMASVWVTVKWPLLFQLSARHDDAELRRVLRPRIWLQMGTFLGLAGASIVLGPTVLRWIGSTDVLLPPGWLALLALNALLESQLTVWTTVILAQNRLPFLWPTLVTNASGLVLGLILILTTPLGIGALVLGPLLSGVVFNYWYWPRTGARSVGTRLGGFLLGRG